MANVIFSRIEKHPLKNCYMLYCKATDLPPYFGSLNECKNAQRHFEEKLRAEFDKLPKYRQREIINELNN